MVEIDKGKKGDNDRRMKHKNSGTCLLLILTGIVLGSFIGSMFPGTFLSFGQTFGLTSPVVLDFGILCITFGLTMKITIASIIGILIGIMIYRFL